MKPILKSLFIGEFTWRRLLRSLILIPIAVIIGLLIIAMFFADHVIFRPPDSSYSDTAEIIKLETRLGDHISAKYQQNPTATYTILFSHGNAEDIGMIEPFAWRLRDQNFNFLTYDYPGYGTSSGSPTEEGVYAAADASYDYLIRERHIDPKQIILFGRSLGGGAAVDLALRRTAAGLILESTFTTAFRVVIRYPLLPFDKFENVKKIDKVSCPVLIIHGTNDRTIPIYHGQVLFEKAREPKMAVWVEGAGHNNVVYTNEKLYFDTIRRFVDILDSPTVSAR